MFGVLGAGSTLFVGARDPSLERDSPPPPTPIRFPTSSRISKQNGRIEGAAIDNLPDWIARIRKPSQISLDILSALNVSIKEETALEDLLGQDQVDEHVPPESWHIESDASVPSVGSGDSASSRRLANGRGVPGQREYSIRLKELRIPNDTGYVMLDGKIRPGGLRIAHLRNFWTGLDSMATFWDTSLDEYIPPKSPGEEVGQDKHLRIEVQQSSTRLEESFAESRKRPRTNGSVEKGDVQRQHQARQGMPRSSGPKTPGTYRGHRMSNGVDMPEANRLNTVRGFLEPITWLFGLTIQPPRRAPLLAIGNLRLPVRLSCSIWRVPSERQKAQNRFVEGPVMSVSCRPEVAFEEDSAEAVVDIISEVAVLLLLAQERAREGKTEHKPGEGKWWTTVPRWGGGNGGEIGEADAKEEIKPSSSISEGPKISEDAIKESLGANVRKPKPLQSVQKPQAAKRAAGAKLWKELRPGAGYWDPKALYQPIGKEDSSEYDKVYLISSLNHHVSILEMRIHLQYLEAITSGELPTEVSSSDSSSVALQRSRWFDLFSVDDRTEAMRAIWGLTSYLTRVPQEHDVATKAT